MRHRYLGYLAIGAAAMLPLAGCGGGAAETETEVAGKQGALLTNLQERCGQAIRGKMVSGENEELADRELVLAIAPCEPGSDVTMALHANVGPLQVSRDQEIWDRSRSMTLSQNGDALTVTLGDYAQDGTAGPMQGLQATGSGAQTDTSQTFTISGAEQPAEQPLVIGADGQVISLQIPASKAAKGFTAEFNASDRVAMPPSAWGPAGS